jgi:CRP-like cAMP-binding protein
VRDDPELLSATDLLAPLSREEVERLIPVTPVKEFEPGRHVYTPAYRGEIFFLLLEGRVRVYRAERGREITLTLIEAGELFGEAAFTTRRRRGAYAEALVSSRVALMSRDALAGLVHREPAVGLRAMELLSERPSLYEQRIVDLGARDVPSRLAGLLLQLAESEGVVTREGRKTSTRYTHEQLAAMIGAKRVAVTRALSGLRRAGAVEVRSRQIYVKNTRLLERAAG